MSVIDLLKKGIEEGDWDSVSQAYTALTGNVIEVPKTGDNANSLLDELEQLKNKILGIKPQQSFRQSSNLFEQMNYDVEPEPGADKLNDNVTRTPRRPPYKPKKVTCATCSKEHEVSPKLAVDGYVCDRCMSKRIPR